MNMGNNLIKANLILGLNGNYQLRVPVSLNGNNSNERTSSSASVELGGSDTLPIINV